MFGIMKRRSLINLAIAFFIIGIVFLTIYLWQLIASRYFSWTGEFDYVISAQFGDFVGGVVGTFWAASGIILLYENYKLQRDEFRDTRNMLRLQIFHNQLNDILNELEEYISKITYSEIVNSFIPDTERRENFNGHSFFVLIYLRVDKLNKNYPLSMPLTEDMIIKDVLGKTGRLINSKGENTGGRKVFSDLLYDLIESNSDYKKHILVITQKMKILLLSIKSAFHEYLEKENTASNDYNTYKLLIKSRLTEEVIKIIFYYSLIEEDKLKNPSLESLIIETQFYDENDVFDKEHLPKYN